MKNLRLSKIYFILIHFCIFIAAVSCSQKQTIENNTPKTILFLPDLRLAALNQEKEDTLKSFINSLQSAEASFADNKLNVASVQSNLKSSLANYQSFSENMSGIASQEMTKSNQIRKAVNEQCMALSMWCPNPPCTFPPDTMMDYNSNISIYSLPNEPLTISIMDVNNNNLMDPIKSKPVITSTSAKAVAASFDLSKIEAKEIIMKIEDSNKNIVVKRVHLID